MLNELIKLPSEKEKLMIVADFVLREDLLFLHLVNYTLKPAFNVKIQFSQSLPGLPPVEDFTKLTIFSHLRYFAPLKEFQIPINRIETVLNALKNNEITVTLTYEDEQKQAIEQKVLHDLRFYKDFPIIIKNNKNE